MTTAVTVSAFLIFKLLTRTSRCRCTVTSSPEGGERSPVLTARTSILRQKRSIQMRYYLGELSDIAIDHRTFDEKTLVTEDFEE